MDIQHFKQKSVYDCPEYSYYSLIFLCWQHVICPVCSTQTVRFDIVTDEVIDETDGDATGDQDNAF
jgi:hypothetical protein